MTQKSYRLQEIAEALGASLRGDPDIMVSGLKYYEGFIQNIDRVRII